MGSDFDDAMLDYKLDATIAKIELEAVLEGAPATVTCCREWAILPHWGNPQSVGLQHEDAPIVRISPGEQYHCLKCGARFTLREDGTVEVGPSMQQLERIVEAAHLSPEALNAVAAHTQQLEQCGYALEIGMVGLKAENEQLNASQEKLLAALYREICLYGQCPGELQDFACPQEHEADKHGPCWLIYYSLAATYADAQALWARMEEAAR